MISEKDSIRFEGKIDKQDNGCWFWKGCKINSGYGIFYFKRKKILAHRFSYMLYKGEILDGLFCCHHCDCKVCVNPDHVFLGTQRDNLLDMVKKGRAIGNRIVKSMLGRKHTKEALLKMSEAKIGNKNHLDRTHSNATKNRLREIRKGKKASEEIKLKMSKSQTGRKHSEETKLKMSLSAKKYLKESI